MSNRSRYLGVHAIEPPAYIKRAIRMRGGVNPYGEPLYRLVHTRGRTALVGGEWTIWAKGTPIADRNPGKFRPLRTVTDIRPVPLYPGEDCWVLERWAPPYKFGSPSMWYQPEQFGGTMRLCGDQWMPAAGLFPFTGDYEDANFYFKSDELSEPIVLHAIGLIEHALAELPTNPQQRLTLALSHAQATEEKQDADFDKFARELLGGENPFDARTPGGQAEVHKLAESIGIREQIW